MADQITIDRAVVQQALEALKYMHDEKCDYMRRNNLGDPLREDAARLALPAINALTTALAQAEPVQEQDVEDAIEAAYWQFDCRRSGLNEWASAPQSERDAFKAEARKLVRGYFPTRQAQDTKREMLAVADAFIRGKRAAPQQQAEPVQPAIPLENSREARQAIEAMLAEYDHPTNPNNAARAGWRAARLYAAPQQQAEPVQEPVGYLPAYELNRLHLGHDGRLRSAKFGPSALDGDVALYTAPPQQAEPVQVTGFRDVRDYISEQESDPQRAARLETARERVKARQPEPVQPDEPLSMSMFASKADYERAQQQAEPERNFCSRCGKRLHGDGIHTCTPPQTTQEAK